MTSLHPRSVRPVRSSEAYSFQSPHSSSSHSSSSHLASFETITHSAKGSSAPLPPLPLKSPLRRLTLALLLTVAATLLLAASILYFPITDRLNFDRQQLREQQQTQQTMLDLAQSYRAQANEANQTACIAEAHHLVDTKPQGRLYAQAQDVLKECQDTLAQFKIAEARQLADGHQADAIALLSKIEGSMQSQAIALSRTWTEQILSLAKAAYQKGNLSEARQLLISIAPDNPIYAEVQANLQAWNQEWSNNDTALETAKTALQANQLGIAQTNLERITSNPHWQEKLKLAEQDLRARQAECERIYLAARQNIDQHDYMLAGQFAAQLPDSPPWGVQKQQIVQQIKAARQKDTAKAIGFSWLLGALSTGVVSLKLRKH